MTKNVFSIICGLLLLTQFSNMKAQTYIGDKVHDSTNYDAMYGMEAKVDCYSGGGNSFIGKTKGNLGFAAAFYATGYGYGVSGSVTELSRLSRIRTGITYGYGGVFSVSLNDLTVSTTNGATCEAVGVKGQISGTISSITNTTLISAVYGNDKINNSNTWAGYFDGKVGVNGTLRADEIIVEEVAADYVFDKGYNLRSLDEVEAFIKENGHLPDVAPASETVKGVNVSEFSSLMLQKIEELTLYVIELKKENEALKEMIQK